MVSDISDMETQLFDDMLLDFGDPNLMFELNNNGENWVSELSSSPDELFSSFDLNKCDSQDNSQELFSSFDPNTCDSQDNSQDIQIDPREWLVTDKNTSRQRPPKLFEFLILLLHKLHYASYASYKNRAEGVFEIHQPEKVANLWQHVKNRQSSQEMTYDKFARAVRWYYKNDIMKKTNARYTFQFSPRTLAAIIIDENNNIRINSPI